MKGMKMNVNVLTESRHTLRLKSVSKTVRCVMFVEVVEQQSSTADLSKYLLEVIILS